MISIHYMVLFGVLLWASGHDLVKHRVPDYVFLIGGGVLLIASVFSMGLSSLLGMGKGVILMMFVGLVIHIIYHFGMADVFALGLIGMAFPPETVPLRYSLSIVLFVMYIWMMFWSFITRKKKVPAIPGILLGAIALLSYTM